MKKYSKQQQRKLKQGFVVRGTAITAIRHHNF
jgi:hypothetical protein